MNSETLTPENQMMQFILNKWISKPIHVVAKLGIPDLLAEKGRNVEELAELTGTLPPPLYRVMRALAGMGIFEETEKRFFINTVLSQCLTEDKLQASAILFQSSWHNRVWDDLLYSMQTGKPAFGKVFGTSIFEWFEKNPKQADIFHKASSFKAAFSHGAIVDAYDFSGIHTITDVGGGTGALLVEILRANPHMSGTVAELAEVVGHAKESIRNNRLDHRMSAVACNFFEEIPRGSDAFLVSHILHDWPDDKCITILKNIRKVINPDGRIIIIDAIIPSGNTFSLSKFLDLEVFLMGGGCERDRDEFAALLAQSGFRLSRIIQIEEHVSIIEGIPE